MLRDGPAHPLVLAAKAAFWQMSRGEIIRFAALKGVHVEGGSSLFTTVLQAVMGVLKCPQERALEITSTRMATEKNSEWCAEQLLNMDEAVELIDHNDKEVYKQANKSAEEKQESMKVFCEEFQLMKQEQISKNAKGKRRKGDPSRSPIPHIMGQEEATLYVPPSVSIWQCNVRREWWGHGVPYKRVVSCWSTAEGESEAIKICLKRLWMQWLEREGRTREDCPWDIWE